MYKASKNIINKIKSLNPLVLDAPFDYCSLSKMYIIGYGFYVTIIPIEPLLESNVEKEFNKRIKVLENYISKKIPKITQSQGDFFILYLYNEGFSEKLESLVLLREYNKGLDFIKNKNYIDQRNYDASNSSNRASYKNNQQVFYSNLYKQAFSDLIIEEKKNKDIQKQTDGKSININNQDSNNNNIQQSTNNDTITLKIDDITINNLQEFLLRYEELIFTTDKSGHVILDELTLFNENNNWRNIIVNYTYDQCLTYFKNDKDTILSSENSPIISLKQAKILPIIPITIITVSKDSTAEILRTTLGKYNTFVIHKDINEDIKKEIDLLLSSDKYKSINSKSSDKSIYMKEHPQISVYLWCKALNIDTPELPIPFLLKKDRKTFPSDGVIINLTRFVDSVQITNAISGGTFNISLPPLTCEWSDRKKCYVMTDENNIIEDNKVKSDFYSKNILFRNYKQNNYKDPISEELTIVSNDSITKKQNQFYFHNIISQNDLIFIAFEDLEIEISETLINNQPITKNKQETGGLTGSTPEFDTQDQKEQLEQVETKDENTLIKKAKDRNNIKDKFILELSDLPDRIYDMIGLVDDCIKSYIEQGNEVSINVSGKDLSKLITDDGAYFYTLQYQGEDSMFLKNESSSQRSYKRLIQDNNGLLVDSKSNRFVADGTINDLAPLSSFYIDALITTLFQRLSNIEICPTDLFRFFDNKSMFSDINGNPDDPVGVWQIFKVYIDKSVAKLRSFDNRKVQQFQGNLVNYINTICQKHFVEFFTDTYFDKHILFIRKPPFDYNGYVNLPKTLVRASDVFSDSLQFENTSYSHYILRPIGLFPQEGQFLSAIYLHQYAQLFGAKPLDVTHTYIPEFNNINDSTSMDIYKQYLIDLGYLIECSAYLPFSRRGSISLRGFRTIKKGTLIYYQPTDEYFYVDSVSHTYSIRGGIVDRVTNLQVSRGLVRKYVVKPSIERQEIDKNSLKLNIDNIVENKFSNKQISYFNLVNFKIDTSAIDFLGIKNGRLSPYILKGDVNPDVFNFFLRREQFKNIETI